VNKNEERTLKSAYNADIELSKRSGSTNGRSKSRKEISSKTTSSRIQNGNKSRMLKEISLTKDDSKTSII
jgi:hypothetical protein